MELRRKRATTIVSVVAMTLLGGCIGPFARGSSRDYAITVNRDTYTRGNTGEATIKNVSDKTLEYNLCQRRLERQENKYWIVAFEWPTAGGTCTTESRRLAKGESVNTFFEIPRGVPTDTYRVMFTGLTRKDGRSAGPDEASTPTFKVQ